MRAALAAPLLAATLAASSLLGPAGSAAPAAAPAPAATKPSGNHFERTVHQATNQRRVKHDRDKLSQGACVKRFAVRQAKRMARQERMYHQDLQPVLEECGLRGVGENVAYGQPTAKAMVKAWMHSEGHRANILSKDWTLLGVGARKSESGRWYGAQVFGVR